VTTGQPLQWTDGRGTDQQPDIHNLNKDNYGAEAQAVLIRTVETHDRIMVDLPYVLVRSGFGRVADSAVRSDQRKDVLYSPHDVSLNDNVLAVVSEYFGRLGPFWDFGSLRSADDEAQSYFAPRPDGSATLDYVIREQGSLEGGRNPKIYGSSNQRDAFLFDGSPSTEATAPKFGEFDYAQGDRLLFTGPENSTIYSQVRYVSDTSSFELVFYSSAQVANNNILAIFDVSAIYNHSSRKWAAGIEVSDPKNANLFLDVNTPTLVDIPVERKYYFSGEGRVELNEEMQGAQFVADYFTSIPYNNRATVINNYNNAVSVQLGKENTVPVIRGFEDGHDKIFLEPGQDRSIWWGESDGNIILYNVENPSNDLHKIAIIEKFEGTFSHADFVTVDDAVEGFPYIDVSADLIVAL